MLRRPLTAVVLLATIVSVSCRIAVPGGAGRRRAAEDPRALVRGAVLYEGYCAGCHGADGRGDGPVAGVLNLRPTDLRAPEVLGGASDEQVIERLLHGTPLRTSAAPEGIGEERQLAALERYVQGLSQRDASAIRAGRLVFERQCAACHGVYGEGMGVIMPDRPLPDLHKAQLRLTDRALASVIRKGIGEMPASELGSAELQAVIAYLRVLSPGYRLYGTYCAACHGDDGRGVHPEDLLPPAITAPSIDSAHLAALSPAERRTRMLHMFRRERGLMPHFREILGPDELRDILAYLRG